MNSFGIAYKDIIKLAKYVEIKEDISDKIMIKQELLERRKFIS